jgi:hypothetical protein
VEIVFAVGWGTFWMYWLIAAFSMKRGRVPWSRELRIRALIVVIVVILVRFGVFRGRGLNTDPWRPAAPTTWSAIRGRHPAFVPSLGEQAVGLGKTG